MSNTTFFLPAFGNRPAQLVDRELVINNFVHGLSQPVGHPDRAVLLIGQRGMGKTALLLEFADRAEQLAFVVPRVTATENILEDLLGAIQLKGSRFIHDKPKVKGVSAGAFGFSVGLTFSEDVERNFSFVNKLTLLADELAKHGKGLVILVDEIQTHTSSLRILTTAFQHLVGENKNIVIVMAGLPHAISSTLSDEVLTFFNRAKKVYLGPLSLSAVSVFFTKVFTELGKKISRENLALIVEATRGYPYLLQLIGFYLLEYVGSAKSITREHIENAIASAKRDMVENIYDPVLKPLSQKDLQFLTAMVKDVGASRVTDIKTRMKTSNAVVQAYRKRLIDAGVIASERRGELAFTIPYIDEYLRGEF